MTLIVDASVMAKWFYPEDGSSDAAMVLDQVPVLAAPAHASAEVGHVLARRVREGSLTLTQMQEALHILDGSVIPIPLADLHDEACVVSAGTGASFYDALYVSAATRWNVSVITADLRLLRICAPTRWSTHLTALSAWAAKS